MYEFVYEFPEKSIIYINIYINKYYNYKNVNTTFCDMKTTVVG